MRNIKMVKVQVLILTLFWLTQLLTTINYVKATPETVVKLEPSISFAKVGETFTVNVTVVNVQNLYGVEIKLYWNTSILEVTCVDVRLGVEDYSDGVLYKPVEIIQNLTFPQEGKYVLAGLSATSEPPLPPSFNGSGNIVKVTFKVVGVGYCELSVETTLASNIVPPGSTAVEPIAHTTINGFFGPILLTAYPKKLIVGENVNISGIIATPQANVTVTIFYKLEDEIEWHTFETKTDEQGNYYYIWGPNKSGKYYLKASAFILGSEEASPAIFINVSESQQPPWPWPYLLLIVVIVLIVTMLLLMRRRKT